MKNLVIDAGNTRIKVAMFIGHELHSVMVFNPAMPEEFVAWCKSFAPQKILLSDVGGKAIEKIGAYLPSVPFFQLSAQLNLPFENLYASKQTLGADRMALVAGGIHFFPGKELLIIDAGTCVTYDVLGSNQKYLGGNITPGLQMRLQAMHTFTGKLPLPDFERPTEVLGTNTQSCLLSGAYFGLVGEIEYFIAHYANQKPNLKVLLTGGDAQTLAKSLKSSIFVHEHLLLYGLNKILSIND
jgi:type III pantothenate kinase